MLSGFKGFSGNAKQSPKTKMLPDRSISAKTNALVPHKTLKFTKDYKAFGIKCPVTISL